jgi:Flp pilus assembly protein CpaB
MASPRDRLASTARTVRRAVLRRRRLLAALLTAVAVASGLHAATAPPPARVGVLVAAHDLAAGSVIAPGDVTRHDFAPASVPDGVAAHPEGRTLAAPLRAGEPLTDVRLVGPALAASYPGLTAVPVRLPDAGMADLLHVGDHVDLVAADPQGSGASVVAADVPVLALPAPSPEEAASGVGALPGRLVVVGADPAEVSVIAGAAVRDFLTFAYSR